MYQLFINLKNAFDSEESSVQYSYWIWYIRNISSANQNVFKYVHALLPLLFSFIQNQGEIELAGHIFLAVQMIDITEVR